LKVTASHRGGDRPFEGDRTIVLQALPAGARITRATFSLAPADPTTGSGEETFVERFAFGAVVGDGDLPAHEWGVTKARPPGAVEVDFHARRTLASVEGAHVDGALLSIDMGGVYIDVNERGSVMTPVDTAFTVLPGHDLPGVTVTKFKLIRPTDADPAPDVDTIAIRSVPSNVTVRVGQLAPVWTRIGDLAAPDTSPDFAPVLQAFLAQAEVSNGACVVPFTVHADGISRLDATVEIDYLIEQSLLPEGLEEVSLPFDLSTRTVSKEELLQATVPADAVVVAGETTARVRGTFDSTRIAPGIEEATVVAEALVEPVRSQAQAVVTPADVVASSVDLLLGALDRSATLSLTLMSDSDGKPLGDSLIDQPIDIAVVRASSGAPSWITAPFRTPFGFQAGRTYWLVLQSLGGRVSWQAGAAMPGRPGLQSSTDEGLSWRASTDPRVAGDLAGLFRLRVTPATFEMPLSVEIGEGEKAQAVSLERFEPLGRIDFSLDVPELADAFNRYVRQAGGGGCPQGEILANGEFDQWHRVGEDVSEPARILVRGSPRVIATTPDGRWGYVGTYRGGLSGEGTVGALERVDLLCELVEEPIDLDENAPFFVGVHPGAPRVYVATAPDAEETGGEADALFVVDTALAETIGAPIRLAGVTGVALNAGGGRLYMARWASNGGAEIGFVETAALDRIAVEASPLSDSFTVLSTVTLGQDEAPGRLEVTGSKGTDLLYLLIGAAGNPGRVLLATADDPDQLASVDVGIDPVDVAATPDGRTLVVASAGGTSLSVIDPETRTARVVALADPPVALAVTPDGGRVFVVDAVNRLSIVDPATGTVAATVDVGVELVNVVELVDVLVAPAGDNVYVANMAEASISVVRVGVPVPSEWSLTSGSAQPYCLAGQVVALLGPSRFARATPHAAGVATGLSQVVPVSARCPLGFSFLGLATVPNATAEILWLGGTCSDLVGTETVVIEEYSPPPNPRSTEARREPTLALHRRAVLVPQGATQAEVRFTVPGSGYAAIDRVSLGATSEVVANSGLYPDAEGRPQLWAVENGSDPAAGSFEQGDRGVVVENAGAEPVAVSQKVPVKGGLPYALNLQVLALGAAAEQPAVELRWVSAQGTPLPSTVQSIPVDAFDRHLLQGTVPEAATEVDVRFEIPTGAVLEVSTVSFCQRDAIEVPVAFRSQAPGELAASGARVVYDLSPRPSDPVPSTGLCPPTPPHRAPGEAPEHCCCPCCGSEEPLKHAEPAVTRAGRPAEIGHCSTCGARVVKVGGRLVPGARRAIPDVIIPKRAGAADVSERAVPGAEVPIAPFRPVTEIGLRELAEPLPRLRPVSVVAVKGIGPSRAARLSRLGLGVVDRLAVAQPQAVAGLLGGVSAATAAKFIEEAREFSSRPPPTAESS
jgi:YVTN family beta-propeller protein